MNNPTDDRIKRLEDRMDRIEQATEPLNLRIERGLRAPEATLLQKIMEMVGAQATDIGKLKGDVSSLKTHMEEAAADIKAIKATLSDNKETYKQARKIADKQFKELSDTQDEQGKKLDLILRLLQKGK